MAEKHIERYFKKRCEEQGAKCYKFTSPGTRGVSDRLVVSPNGITYFVELKYGRNGLSPTQELFKKEMGKRGVTVYYMRTKEEVDHFIENILF